MPADYYDVLGVSSEASAEEIKTAFRRLAREHHPDATGGDPSSEHRYKDISEAYAVLADPQKRREYDAARLGVGTWSTPWASPFASTIEDIFETFFGGGGAGRTQTRQQTRSRRGESVEIELAVTLEEVVFGGQRSIRFERFEPCERCSGEGTEPGTHAERCGRCRGAGHVQETRRTILGSLVTAMPCRDCSGTGWVVPDPCKDCRGVGRVPQDVEVPVEVPPGIDDGDRLRLDGEGEAGAAGGGRGNLFVRFRVEPDERFERAGDDLYSWVDVPLTTAALGGSVTISTLDGEEELEIPDGTQSGSVLRLKGLGVPKRSGRGRGHLVLRTHVVTPERLGRKEKELLKGLAALRGEDGKGGVRTTVRRTLDHGR
ncbi:MAG: molecular chaperone DnaJ [Actinomycetota bacterium]